MTATLIKIDPAAPDNEELRDALRRVSRHWFLCYSKLMSLDWYWTNDTPFGATDGASLYLNPDGLRKLAAMPDGTGVVAFLLVHEALHALLGHGWRLEAFKNKKLGNVAADYIVNAMIVQQNRDVAARDPSLANREAFPLLQGVLIDEKLSGDKSVEQLYRELLLKAEDAQQRQQQRQQQQPAPASPEAAPASPEAAPACEIPAAGGVDNIAPTPKAGETTEETINRIEQGNDFVITSAAIEQRAQGSGDSSAMRQRINNERVQVSSLDWCALLDEYLNTVAPAYASAPFNAPVFMSTRLICCGSRPKRTGEVVMVLDTSGSVKDSTVTKFLGEVERIMAEVKPERLCLLGADRTVRTALILTEGDPMPTTLGGGGGTRFKPAFDWVAENCGSPDVLVYLTDGLSPDLTTLPPVDYPVLWLSTVKKPDAYPFGDVISVTELV